MIETLQSTAEAPNLEQLEAAALPVCLPPWRKNPYRLVSLWDMVNFDAGLFLEKFSAADKLECLLSTPSTPTGDAQGAGYLDGIPLLGRACERLGLSISAI